MNHFLSQLLREIIYICSDVAFWNTWLWLKFLYNDAKLYILLCALRDLKLHSYVVMEPLKWHDDGQKYVFCALTNILRSPEKLEFVCQMFAFHRENVRSLAKLLSSLRVNAEFLCIQFFLYVFLYLHTQT